MELKIRNIPLIYDLLNESEGPPKDALLEEVRRQLRSGEEWKEGGGERKKVDRGVVDGQKSPLPHPLDYAYFRATRAGEFYTAKITFKIAQGENIIFPESKLKEMLGDDWCQFRDNGEGILYADKEPLIGTVYEHGYRFLEVGIGQGGTSQQKLLGPTHFEAEMSSLEKVTSAFVSVACNDNSGRRIYVGI